MSMSYANMIEEKKMKKMFILATLVSTIVGTFTTSIGLYDRLADRRQQQKQKKLDAGQDKRLAELEKQVEEADKRSRRKREGIEERDLENSLERSGPLIQREYNANFNRLGRQFAIGDTITQNQLQAELIGFQQTVINVLQNAVMTGQKITPQDVSRLYIASESAREGSVGALQQQYQRMLTAAPIQQQPSPPLTPVSPIKRSLPQASSTSSQSDSSPLFCPFSIDLQQNPGMGLGPSFWPGGDNGCPACGSQIPIQQGRTWKITREVEHLEHSSRDYDDIVVEERTFNLSNRFVIKCHRNNGEFACVLCSLNREKDTVCESINGLVRHVWRVHDISEYEREIDIRGV